MTGRLAGKTALVTGSSRGIGKATALRLAHDGARVAIHCRSRRDEAEEVARLVREHRGEALVVQADIATMDGVATLMAEVDQWLGAAPLDIVVNNAAVHALAGQFGSVTPENFDRTIATNLRAPFFIAQAAAERMGEGGRIVFIGAVAARHAYPHDPIYAATKGALASLTLALAKELGPRAITVNTVVPGVTDTEMLDAHRSNQAVMDWMIGETSLARIGTAQDVADVIAAVVGPDGRWITGQCVDATGGLWI
jgi:3-oxoacyl-[acyl-carrier protein] reductase